MVAAAEAAHPDTFVTRSGPNADKDQHLVPYLREYDTARAFNAVQRRLLGVAEPVIPVPVALIAPGPP